jgi:hypothetical protein
MGGLYRDLRTGKAWRVLHVGETFATVQPAGWEGTGGRDYPRLDEWWSRFVEIREGAP